VHEDTKKFYFTLMDFRGATSHFADPEFDGEPVQIYAPAENDPINPPDAPPAADADDDPIPPEPADDEVIVDGVPPDISIAPGGEKRRKVYVDGVGAAILTERVEYLDEYGKLVTESLRDFTRKALGLIARTSRNSRMASTRFRSRFRRSCVRRLGPCRRHDGWSGVT
jgi:type I restriction enzyme R subunit